MSGTPDHLDIFVFADDQTMTEQPHSVVKPWPVLVVDDDPDVHASTAFALDLTWPLERPIQLLHADSAAAAQELLAQRLDVAVVLLDVVMERADSGLKLVDTIRNELGLSATRIVLRTGQPGYAPEHETLARYDINDYRSKSELTQHKLVSTLMAAVRSYEQIRTIEASRRGLQQIVLGSAALLELPGLQRFADGVLTQVAALLGVEPQGLVCAQGQAPQGPYTVLAAAGPYTGLINQPLERLNGHPAVQHLQYAFQTQQSYFGRSETVLYVGPENELEMAIYLPTGCVNDALMQQLLDVLCVNLSACLRNLELVSRLQQAAYQDLLLGIANRTRMIQAIEACMASGVCEHSLILADIDDFGGINELMGHSFGDQVLQALAQRLLQAVPEQVLLARVSGNAFGLFGPSACLQPMPVFQVCDQALTVAGQPFKVRLSMGLCVGADLGRSGADALKNAAIALKHAKQQQRGALVRFDPTMAQRSRHHAELLAHLTAAFNEEQLFLVFQPQVDLASRRVCGIEALLRWRREDGQMVPPDRFIPIAEQSGLIDALGLWVFKGACLAMRQLSERGLAPELMAVNVSVVQFRNPEFVAHIERALLQVGLAAQRVELEVTESVAALGLGVVEPQLQRLRELGLSIAIDDFGTGYSSLAYLERLPLDRIKIDRSFVHQMELGEEGRITSLVAQLGQRMGLRVLAEGIEQASVWQRLLEAGCHEGQGYLIARPMPFNDLVSWLQQWPGQPSN